MPIEREEMEFEALAQVIMEYVKMECDDDSYALFQIDDSEVFDELIEFLKKEGIEPNEVQTNGEYRQIQPSIGVIVQQTPLENAERLSVEIEMLFDCEKKTKN